jgi:hypothetical protein
LFSEGERTGQIKIRFGGLSDRGKQGTFYGWIGKEEITAASNESVVSHSFIQDSRLPPAGRAKKHSSLRRGFVKFNEGNTISYATNEDGSTIIKDSDLWSFKIIPRPFTVFHDTNSNIG